MTVLPIVDLHTCIQGEGKFSGVPHILIRFTGCVLRCKWCDTPYSSITPEKGRFTLSQVKDFVLSYPQIKHAMITGGSPTLHPNYLVQIVNLLKKEKIHVTIETEGTRFVQTNADFISLSPKFESSAPDKVKQSDAWLHHCRLINNYDVMKKMIACHKDYQVKPVITCQDDLLEVFTLKVNLNIPASKIYLMPQGITPEEIVKASPQLIEFCIDNGFNYCPRIHTIIYGNKRDV